MISMIKQRFECIGEPYSRWYYFYIEKPFVTRNAFAVLLCSISTSNVCIRADLSKFDFDDPEIRKVKSWFFRPNDERRIALSQDNLERILEYLEHSYKVTKEFSPQEFKRWSKVAKRAAATTKRNKEAEKNLDSFSDKEE